MGESPRSLLDAFEIWVLGGMPLSAVVEIDDGRRRVSWHVLCERVRECDEAMPPDVCDWLDVLPGTPYADAAQQLLDSAGDRSPILLEGIDADGSTRGWTGTEWIRLTNDEQTGG
jgi:hypothetical protein